MPHSDLLIVFTDEVGSTKRDCRLHEPEDIIAPRSALFGIQLKNLEPMGWSVLKNVGDSLVLKFNPEPLTAEAVAKAVYSMFLAWEKRLDKATEQLRVAVHRPLTPRFASGELLHLRLTESVANDRIRLWRSFDSLRDDLFGLEMNLAARLAGLPSGNAFIVSESVLTGNDGLVAQALSGLLGDKYYLGPRVPITNLRGFDGYLLFDGIVQGEMTNYDQTTEAFSLWAREILPRTIVEQHHSLIADSRRHQVIRTIMISCAAKDITEVSRIVSPIPHQEFGLKLAENGLKQLLQDGSALSFHADALFKIEATWEGRPARLDRTVTPTKQPWLRRSESLERVLLPTSHILFTSAFDESVDDLVSLRIKKTKLSHIRRSKIQIECTLVSESNLVFKKTCWQPNAIDTLSSSYFYYILIFQIKSNNICTPNEVWPFQFVEESVADLEPVSWGMLRGRADGYILYRAPKVNLTAMDGDKSRVEEMADLFKLDPAEERSPFLAWTIPLILHKLSFVWKQPVPELRSANEFRDNENWRLFIEPAKLPKSAEAHKSLVG